MAIAVEAKQNSFYSDIISGIYAQLNSSKQPIADCLYKNMRVDTVKHLLYGVELGATVQNKRPVETFRSYSIDLSDIGFIYTECNETKPYDVYITIEAKNREAGKDWKFRFALFQSTSNQQKLNIMNDLKVLCQLAGSYPAVLQTDFIKQGIKGNIATITETVESIYGANTTKRIKKSVSKVVFNRNGNIMEESEFDAANHFKGKTTYIRNFRGQSTEETTFYANGKVASKHSYKYNSEGNLLEEIYYSKKEHKSEPPTKKISYSYQQKGDTLLISQYDEEKFLLFKTITVTTDSLCETTEFKYHHGDDLIQKFVFNYDRNGNLIESAQDSDVKIPAVLSPTYEYDALGNWLKLTTNQNGSIQCVKERKITYY